MNNNERPYDIATIRKLLLAAFTPEELRRFCEDRPLFKSIVFRFGPGQGLDDMVGEVIDYCRTQFLLYELLAAVKEANPRQYARFEPNLPDIPSPDAAEPKSRETVGREPMTGEEAFPAGAALPIPAQHPPTQSGDSEEPPHPGRVLKVLRDPVWQGVGAITAIVAIAITISWPYINSALFPTPTATVSLGPSATTTSTPIARSTSAPTSTPTPTRMVTPTPTQTDTHISATATDTPVPPTPTKPPTDTPTPSGSILITFLTPSPATTLTQGDEVAVDMLYSLSRDGGEVEVSLLLFPNADCTSSSLSFPLLLASEFLSSVPQAFNGNLQAGLQINPVLSPVPGINSVSIGASLSVGEFLVASDTDYGDRCYAFRNSNP